jgi:hypothetical protein
MFDYESNRASTVAYWSEQPTHIPYYINGFNGKFAYSDHSLIPDSIVNFLIEYFWNDLPETRKSYTAISLDKINSCLNEIWEGPGSMVKLVNIMYDLRQSRLNLNPNGAKDALKGYKIPTIESDLVVDEAKE